MIEHKIVITLQGNSKDVEDFMSLFEKFKETLNKEMFINFMRTFHKNERLIYETARPIPGGRIVTETSPAIFNEDHYILFIVRDKDGGGE